MEQIKEIICIGLEAIIVLASTILKDAERMRNYALAFRMETVIDLAWIELEVFNGSCDN